MVFYVNDGPYLQKLLSRDEALTALEGMVGSYAQFPYSAIAYQLVCMKLAAWLYAWSIVAVHGCHFG